MQGLFTHKITGVARPGVLLLLTTVFLALPPVSYTQAVDPAQLSARESHEGLTIFVDPYTSAARVKEKFGKKHPYDADILPVEVIFKNDSDHAIRVTLEEIRLLISPPDTRRQRLEPLDFETVIERTLHEEKGGPEVKKPRVPIPIPRSSKDRSKEWKKLEEIWEAFLLSGDVLPPKSVMRGFLFFDMGRHMDWVVYARLLVPRLRAIEANQDMFFFEIDLSKALPKS